MTKAGSDERVLAQLAAEGITDWPANASLLVIGTFTPEGATTGTPFRAFFDAEVKVELELPNAPPPGECRVWYAGRPQGHQPPPARCDRLVGRVPYGVFILYNDKEWDTQYDWRGQERRRRGSVPPVILDLTRSLVR